MNSNDYERAVCELFKTIFPEPKYVITHNAKKFGSKSRIQRQIDVHVREIEKDEPFAIEKDEPFVIAEAKCHRRPINVNQAGSIIAMSQDIKIPFVAVSSSGFSAGALSHLSAEGIDCMVLNILDAEAFNHVPGIQKYFFLDPEFRLSTGHLAQAIAHGNFESFALGIHDEHTGLPFEEWHAVISYAYDLCRHNTVTALIKLARSAPDDAVRFNALSFLLEKNAVDKEELCEITCTDLDPEIRDLFDCCES